MEILTDDALARIGDIAAKENEAGRPVPEMGASWIAGEAIDKLASLLRVLRGNTAVADQVLSEILCLQWHASGCDEFPGMEPLETKEEVVRRMGMSA